MWICFTNPQFRIIKRPGRLFLGHPIDGHHCAVVEDEPLLRMAAVDLVEEAGFLAIEAGNADDAIRLLELRNDIRIVFTDIDMPGSMDGLKLAAAVRAKWPPISIIVVSGHRKPELEELPAGTIFFAKPYPHEAVISTLRKLAA